MRAFGKIDFTSVLIAVLAIIGPASAVDLVNSDRVARETVVNRSDGESEVLTLKPGQRIANICTACVILVGESSVEVSGRITVRIEGGRLRVAR